MKLITSLLLFIGLSLTIFGQDRQTALVDFNAMKTKAAELDLTILAPEESDVVVALQQNAIAIRLLPRETYDNSFSSIRGGGAYHSFFFRSSHYGSGSDLGWEGGYLSTGYTDFALMADLGEVRLDQITRDSHGVIDFANFRMPKDPRSSPEFDKARSGKLMIGETLSVNRIKPIVGHSYVIRSAALAYYDILVAFTVYRKDTDNSLILLWKPLEQYDTPRRGCDGTAVETDDQIRTNAKGWLRDERLKGIEFQVSNKVVTLTGSVDRQFLPYAIQLANGCGTSKTINRLEPR
ncbi:MAG: BON domain-containing protein [Pyrinomonadaceae bacterium]